MRKLLFAMSVLWSTSLCAGWGTPFQVYTDNPAYSPVSGIDNSGNGLVAYYWQHFMDAGAGATQIVNGAPVNPVSYPPLQGPMWSVNIAVNGTGNATLVWVEHSGDDSTDFVRSASFLNNAWSPVSPAANQLSNPAIENALNNSLPGVTKDSSNNSIGLWNLTDISFSDYTVAYNLLQSGTWTGENPLFTPTTDYIPISYLAGSPSGHGFAIWSNSGPYILQGSYYNGSTWTNNLSISTDLLQNCVPTMDVSMNSSNNALIAWAKQSDGGVGAILVSGGVYGSQETVYVPTGNFTTQEISTALNDAGDGAAGWIAYDSSTSQWNLYMAFRINNSWQTPLLIDTITTEDSAFLSKVNIALDNNGNAYVVWQRTDDSSNSAIEGSNIAKGAAVSPGYVLISTDNTTNAANPSLAVNGFGQTIVSWQSGTFETSIIEAAVGSFSSAPTPPQNLKGTQVKDQFAYQTDKVNVLTWTASLDPSVRYYYIFRNHVFIGLVPAASLLRYEDHNQTSHRTYYQVTAVNGQNVQSAPVTVVIH